MTKTWKEITTSLNEAKFKLPRDQKEVKRDTTKVSGRSVDVTYAEDKRGKIHVYIDRTSMGDPYRNMREAEKEMKSIKVLMKQMGEENISKEEILGAINEINI